MAALFDLRFVIGLLFVVYGGTLTILGLLGTSDADLAKAGGIALNLWSGVAMLVAGLAFFAWVWAKPPLPPVQHPASDDDLPEQMRHHH